MRLGCPQPKPVTPKHQGQVDFTECGLGFPGCAGIIKDMEAQGANTSRAQTLGQCKAAGIPVYEFGSPELDALHEAAKEPVRRVASTASGWWGTRSSYSVQMYGWQLHGMRYVVDHGGFFTLNTIERGQVLPRSVDCLAH